MNKGIEWYLLSLGLKEHPPCHLDVCRLRQGTAHHALTCLLHLPGGCYCLYVFVVCMLWLMYVVFLCTLWFFLCYVFFVFLINLWLYLFVFRFKHTFKKPDRTKSESSKKNKKTNNVDSVILSHDCRINQFDELQGGLVLEVCVKA